MKKLARPLFSLLAAGLALLPATAFHPASVAANEVVSVWLTTGDQSKLLQQQANVSFGSGAPATGTTITVDENTTYQTMDGFGAAMTGSAAYVLNHDMSASQRDALLTELFGPSGIHLSFMRHSIGASDFSPPTPGDFTYDDRPAGQTDTGLSAFSIANDLTDVVPMLKAALAKNSGLKILGTPWSAPAWMKTNGSLRNGGSLNTAYYSAYANYFVKYVQAFAAQQVPIYAVTLQNEPLYAAGYMSMSMQPNEEAAFLKVIGPAFQSAGLATKLIVYDHNWDQPSYPQTIFADAAAAQYAAGTAWHGYSDPSGISNQTAVHNAYPTKDTWFTEITGNANGAFAGDLKWHMSNIIIGTTRNWAKGALEWNLALDQNSGPVNGGYNNGRGVVTINSSTGAVTRNEEYYALGHASKFVDQGAVRIASNSVAGGIENVAFRNPDGSKVLVALNNSAADITFKVQWGSQSFNYTLTAGSVATYKWGGTVTTTPTVTTSGTLSAFSTTTGTPSAVQSYSVSGVNLSSALTVGPLTGYQFSSNGGGSYAASLSLTPSNGTVGNTTISVRLTGATAGTYNGNIANASTGATTGNVAASGTVSAPAPTIVTSGSLSAFSTNTGSPSAAQTYTVSGSTLSSALTVGPLAGYEFSSNGGSSYAASLSLAPSGGTVGNTTISVRLTGATAGSYNGNIANASTGATTKNVAASGTVSTPAPTITTSGSLSAFSTVTGTPSAAQTYTVSGTTLSSALTVGPLTGYQFSSNGGSSYAASLSLTPSGGTVGNTTISVRLTGATAGTYNGNIANASTGATTRNVAASGTVNTPSNTSGITSGHIYKVISQNSGKALDVKDVSTADGASLQQWTYGGGSNQKWRVEDVGGGYYRFTSLNSGKAMEVAGSSTANGATVQQWTWGGGDNQRWSLTLQPDGSYQVLNKHSGKALDVRDMSTSDGAGIQQWDWSGSGGSNQKWLFTDLGTARAALATVPAGSPADSRLQVYPTVANQEVQLDYNAGTAQSLGLSLRDLTGRVLTSQLRPVTTGNNHFTLPVGTLAAGLYLLQVNTAEGSLVRRVMVAH